MSNAYRLLIFDWEGTLTDAFGQLVHMISQEASQLGLPVVSEKTLQQYVEGGLVFAVKKIYPQLPEEKHQALIDSIRLAMVSKPQTVYLLPEAKAFIKKAHEMGYFLAIASNKGRQSLLRALESCGMIHYFDLIQTASDAPAKPHPQMLLEILRYFSLAADEALMIGDSAMDIEMANAAEVPAVGMDYYHQQTESLLNIGAKQVFDNYHKLAAFLGTQL